MPEGQQPQDLALSVGERILARPSALLDLRGDEPRTSGVTSMPDMPGITTSMTTTSGFDSIAS